MTVKELKIILESFDESLSIGGSGNYGEILEIYDVYLADNFVALSIELPGEL